MTKILGIDALSNVNLVGEGLGVGKEEGPGRVSASTGGDFTRKVHAPSGLEKNLKSSLLFGQVALACPGQVFGYPFFYDLVGRQLVHWASENGK